MTEKERINDAVLTFDRIRNMCAEVADLAPDPKEFRVHHLTMIGHYSSKWRLIEESNIGPFGPLFPVVEDDRLTEGIVILRNLCPRNDPLFTVIDLRE